MASDNPQILHPKPRRPFNPNTAPEQPPSPLLTPSAGDNTPSRTHSILNLTSSTLLGIYSPTGYDNEREEPSTPWGTGAETPAVSSTYFPTRRTGVVPPAPQQSWVSFGFGLLMRVILLGGLGMLYGVLVRHLHHERKLAPFQVESIIKPGDDWRYLLFWGVAGVALGSLLPWIDTLCADKNGEASSGEKEGSPEVTAEEGLESTGIFGADWTPVVRSVGAFVGIAFAIRRLPWTSTLQASLTLALVNPVLWYIIDRSKPGFILSSAVGATGTALLLASNPDMMPSPASPSRNTTLHTPTGILYVSRESLEGGIWIISVLFCSCVCFGNIGRRLALSGGRDRAPAGKGFRGKGKAKVIGSGRR